VVRYASGTRAVEANQMFISVRTVTLYVWSGLNPVRPWRTVYCVLYAEVIKAVPKGATLRRGFVK
jgi:hypothetical protein